MISVAEVLKWVTGFVAIATAGGVIAKWFTPYKALKSTVEHNTKLLKKDNERIIECEAADKQICVAMLALLDHGITGNSVDRLRKARDNMQEYLADR